MVLLQPPQIGFEVGVPLLEPCDISGGQLQVQRHGTQPFSQGRDIGRRVRGRSAQRKQLFLLWLRHGIRSYCGMILWRRVPR
jgi:hypothetical protein